MSEENTYKDFDDIEIFAESLQCWFDAGGASGVPAYEDLKIEQLGKHVGHASIIEWIDRNTAPYVMQGSELVTENHLDPAGLSLFDMVHEGNLEKVKDFDEAVVKQQMVGLAIFSVHLENGLSKMRKMVVFPTVSRRSGRNYLFVCVEPVALEPMQPTVEVLEYCLTHFSCELVPPTDLLHLKRDHK